MKLPQITIAAFLALAIICTVVAVSLVNSTGNWLLAAVTAVVPLLILLQLWRPRMRPAYARAGRK